MARTWITKVNNVDTVDAAHINDLQTYKLDKDALEFFAAGAEGQILEMGASLPGWGRKITISAADPSGGSDGDLWMKY